MLLKVTWASAVAVGIELLFYDLMAGRQASRLAEGKGDRGSFSPT